MRDQEILPREITVMRDTEKETEKQRDRETERQRERERERERKRKREREKKRETLLTLCRSRPRSASSMAGEIDGIPWSSALVVLPARPYNSIKMSAGLPVSPGWSLSSRESA